ncbi:hypothetical protein QQF64_015206, partial [Cirrhinus molitorella]
VMTADQIRPNKEEIVIKEEETVTLSCTYDTSSSSFSLYWYRQYPNGEPQYLIYKYSGGGGCRSEDTVHQNMRVQTADEGAAVINCSYTTTDTGPTLFWYQQKVNGFPKYMLNRIGGDTAVSGNVITPDETEKFAEEGSNVTLSCSYSSADYLYWYRQYPRSAPECLVLIFDGATNTKVSDVDPRFSVKLTNGNKKHVDLKISSAAVSDSALYYCALRPTVTGNTLVHYKNPLSSERKQE